LRCYAPLLLPPCHSGLFEEEREAAIAYDRALVRLRGSAAATNFILAEYRRELAEFTRMQEVGER
jgi:AP2-like factor (euAP2 lineage)